MSMAWESTGAVIGTFPGGNFPGFERKCKTSTSKKLMKGKSHREKSLWQEYKQRDRSLRPKPSPRSEAVWSSVGTIVIVLILAF